MDAIFRWDGLPDRPALPKGIRGCSALLDPAEASAGRSALRGLLEAAVLPRLVAAAGCAALPTLLAAAEEKKLRSAAAPRSELLQLVGA